KRRERDMSASVRESRLPIEKVGRFGRGAAARGPMARLFSSPGEDGTASWTLGQVSWLPDHPRRTPSQRLVRRQWVSDLSVARVRSVPGHSGGGRAGITPASLFGGAGRAPRPPGHPGGGVTREQLLKDQELETGRLP